MVSNQSVPFLSKSIDEIADRRVGLELLHRVFGELEGLRIELGDELIAEVRVPDHAVASTITSCGSIVGRGIVVLGHDRTRWTRPVGRGSVLRSYSHLSVVLRLMVAR